MEQIIHLICNYLSKWYVYPRERERKKRLLCLQQYIYVPHKQTPTANKRTDEKQKIEIHQSQNVCARDGFCFINSFSNSIQFNSIYMDVWRAHEIYIHFGFRPPMNRTKPTQHNKSKSKMKNKLWFEILLRVIFPLLFLFAGIWSFAAREIAVIWNSQFNGLELVWREVYCCCLVVCFFVRHTHLTVFIEKVLIFFNWKEEKNSSRMYYIIITWVLRFINLHSIKLQ